MAESPPPPPPSLGQLRKLMKGKRSPGKESSGDEDSKKKKGSTGKAVKKLSGTKRKKGERRTVDRSVREEDSEVAPVAKKPKTQPVIEPNASSRESIRESGEQLTGRKRAKGNGYAVEVGQDDPVVARVAKKWKPEPVPEDIRLNASSTVVVAFAPDMPQRYGHLLRSITFLLPYKSEGKAYECDFNRVDDLLSRTRCDLCLFFQWVQRDKKMFCWIINTLTSNSAQFLVNPAFVSEMLEVKVKRAACAFSLNFCSDEKWAGVKNALEMLFSPPQHKTSEAPDNMYVFTRIDDCVYFRNIKIKVCPIRYCSSAPKVGSCIAPHSLYLNGENYMILMENGQDLSAFEGYNVSLEEFLGEQPLLKIKHIVGSKTGEECLFVRNIAKYIIRSILAYLSKLFSRGKCMKMKKIRCRQILLKGSKVKFYGVEFVQFEENQAKDNVVLVVKLIIGCFPEGLIPTDLDDMLHSLLSDPLGNLEAGKGDCCLLSAKERRELLVFLHTEYMTNVKPMLCGENGDQQYWNNFFIGCPYINTWVNTMTKNTYLVEVARYNKVLGDLKLEQRKEENKEKEKEKLENEEDDLGKVEENKVEEKEKLENEEGDVGKLEDKKLAEKGERQFHVLRNCDVHIPEKAVKDGISPFRLTWCDYIRTCYFRKYLSFMQRRMAMYLKPKK